MAEPQVSGYAVGRLLGTGSSAAVWLATEQRTGRDFALKCFRAPGERARSGEAMTEHAVRREIRILSVLEHEHLIRSHDAVRLAGGPEGGTGLLMDYAPGGSLAALVGARGRLSVGETVTVLTPLAQALGYLHSKGFTHSDVSPGNVLFTGQGKPMLSDVGVARMVGDPADRAGYGTPGFVDPLPVDAVRAGLQPGRDVYSAAAVGWFCLTGSAPQRTADRPPLSLLVPDVPKELAAVLEAGLNEDRRLRPTALALATEVYRSAPPLPVDLASAVHPTVIPELLTRRSAAVQKPADRVRRHLQAAHRRLATSAWWGRNSGHRLPFPQARSGVRAGGKHAGAPRIPAIGRKTIAGPAVVAAALGAAGVAGWLIWAGVVPAEFPPGTRCSRRHHAALRIRFRIGGSGRCHLDHSGVIRWISLNAQAREGAGKAGQDVAGAAEPGSRLFINCCRGRALRIHLGQEFQLAAVEREVPQGGQPQKRHRGIVRCRLFPGGRHCVQPLAAVRRRGNAGR